ncbi:MAG: glycosyltransferase 87 family protein, partial [Lachnospiraceae bacterium]|nr:glycosyltransferase 87 family protein [Lachnospiraceae bacterium]
MNVLGKYVILDGKKLLRLFWIIILLSFAVWLISIIISPNGHQLDLFFLRTGDFWADASNVTGLVSERDPYHNARVGIGLGNANQPPLTYICYFLLACVSIIPDNSYLNYYYQPMWTMLFVIILCVTMIMIFEICVRQFPVEFYFDALLIGASICFSYPMIFSIERGNNVIVSALMVSVFVFYYDNNIKWKKEIALICLAIASGMKISPAILGILLVYKKDWSAVCRLALYDTLFFIGPFVFLKGGINNLFQMIHNLNLWFTTYVSYNEGTGFVASYVKYIRFFYDCRYISDTSYKILTVLKSEVSFILLLGAFHFEEKWKCVFNVILVLLVLPTTSAAYCLLYLIPFTVLFLNS